MKDRLKLRLTSENSKSSVVKDLSLAIELKEGNRLLPIGDINKIINVAEQADLERQKSNRFRFLGTISPLFTNVLFDVNNNDGNGWARFNDIAFKDRSFPNDGDFTDRGDLNYKESLDFFLREEDGFFGFRDPNPFVAVNCELIEMSPTSKQFALSPKSNNKNWELLVSYPAFSARTTGDITDGGLMVIKEEVVFAGREMLGLTTPVKHNLKINDTVRFVNINNNYEVKDYQVIRLGKDNGDMREYTFVIDPTPTNSSVVLGSNPFIINSTTRMIKIVNGEPSVYYYRVFKRITETSDYEVYPLAFANGVYNDKTNQYAINEELDLTSFKDNLGRPISEVFITLIKNNGDGFTNIKSGIDVPFLESQNEIITNIIGNIRRIHNSPGPGVDNPSHTPLETNVKISDEYFYGDVVEYNRFDLKETVLGDVMHRFNRVNREVNKTVTNTGIPDNSTINLGPRYEGYYYKPHTRVKLRNFSSFIEQGDSSVIGIPDYAEDLGDGRFIWRDLLSFGFNDGQEETKNYPFLNNCHYVYNNISLSLKRQDPFGVYGLYYEDFPRDSFGSQTEDDNIIIKRGDDVC